MQIEFEATQAAARRLGLALKWLPIYTARDFDAAFDAIAREGAQALIAVPDTLINFQARTIAEFATARRIPAISGWAEFAEAGNLMSYGPDRRGFFRQASVNVDKLLRGAKAAELPVEQPRELEFVVNLRTAKAIGLRIQQPILLRANRVID